MPFYFLVKSGYLPSSELIRNMAPSLVSTVELVRRPVWGQQPTHMCLPDLPTEATPLANVSYSFSLGFTGAFPGDGKALRGNIIHNLVKRLCKNRPRLGPILCR